MVAERLSNIQKLQNYSIESIDRTLLNWSSVTRFIAGQVMEHPKEGEIVLRSTMTLHQDIIQIKIHSSNLSDELVSHNTAFPSINIQVKDNEWFYSSSDSILRAAWLNDPSQNPQYFITQIHLQVESIPFVLTIVWNAKILSENFTNSPIYRDYPVSVQSASAVLMTNPSFINTIGFFNTRDTLRIFKNVVQGKNKWRVVHNDFRSFPFSMVVAVPELVVVTPVEKFIIYSASFIIGLMSIVFMICVYLIFQVKRTTKKK